jgi:hypothetical protein
LLTHFVRNDILLKVLPRRVTRGIEILLPAITST